MLFAWLYLFLTEVFGDRFRQYLEPVLNRQHERLQKRLSRLQISSTEAGDLTTSNQYKSPYQKTKTQCKMTRKAERLTRKSSRLLKMIKPVNETSEGVHQLQQELGGKWINEIDNVAPSAPPAYDEIFPQHPPAYEDIQGSRKNNLYPILT